jgi:DNA replication protein DnaC
LDLLRFGVGKKFVDIDLREVQSQGWLPAGYRKLAVRALQLVTHPQLMALGGRRGTGKTAIGSGACRAFKESDKYPRYQTALKCQTDLVYAPWDRKERILDQYRRADFLVLDEYQGRDRRPGFDDLLIDLIDNRYANNRATLLITNSVAEAFEQDIGESVHRRLSEVGGYFECDWPRIQTLIPPDAEANSPNVG